MNNKKVIFKRIRSEISTESFKARPIELLAIFWILFCFVVSYYLLIQNFLLVKILGSLLIGYSFSAMAFLFHDLRHGGVIKNKHIINFLSQFLIWPCLISSHFWDFWHNQLHHKYNLIENRLLKEYPTDSFFKKTFWGKIIKWISPPENGFFGFIYLFFWYVPYVVLVQTLLSFQLNRFKDLKRKIVIVEFVGALLFWVIFLRIFSQHSLIFTIFIPLSFLSYCLSSYVVTNHHPKLIDANSMNVNACTVEVSQFMNLVHFNFSYHTEHHLFPEVNPYYLPKISKLLKQNFPENYFSLKKYEALKKIYFSN